MDPSSSSLGVNLNPIVGQGLAALCLQEELADIHFVLPRKEDPTNYKRIPAHSFVLRFASDVFAQMFSGNWRERIGQDIALDSMEEDIFEALLRFVYTGNLDMAAMDIESMLSLHNAARQYLITKLEERCLNKLIACLEPAQAMTVLDFTLGTGEELERRALQLCARFPGEVIESEAFLAANWKALQMMFQLKSISASFKEVDLFKAAMKWAKTECLRLKKEITKENLLDVLEPILKHIRFPAMDIKDFTTVVVSEQLFSKDEEYEIMMQIGTGEPTQSIICYNSVPRTKLTVASLSIKVEKFANFVVENFANFVGPTVEIDGQPFNLEIWKCDANLKAPSATTKYLSVFLFRSTLGEFADSHWDRWVEVRFHIKSSRDSSADIVGSAGLKNLTKESRCSEYFEMTTETETLLNPANGYLTGDGELEVFAEAAIYQQVPPDPPT